MCRSYAAVRPLATQVQTFLVIDQPAFMPKQYMMDMLSTIADASGGHLKETLAFGTIIPRSGTIEIGGLPQLHHGGNASDADAKRIDQKVDQFVFVGWFHRFFWMIS